MGASDPTDDVDDREGGAGVGLNADGGVGLNADGGSVEVTGGILVEGETATTNEEVGQGAGVGVGVEMDGYTHGPEKAPWDATGDLKKQKTMEVPDSPSRLSAKAFASYQAFVEKVRPI